MQIPMAQGEDWHGEAVCDDKCNHQYQMLIGSLMNLAVCTRPDISNSVAVLSQFNNCHGPSHWGVEIFVEN